MAVTITKKFHNGTEYKDIAKVVFTSPNFTSPAVAGTRSHMPPGGAYMGTWFEAVDWMYREFPTQDYAQLPDEMESLFGKLTALDEFSFATGTSGIFWYDYSTAFDVLNPVDSRNVLYIDKTNYGTISTCISGTTTLPDIGVVNTVNLGFSNAVGSRIINEWINSSVIVSVNTLASGIAIGDTNPVTCDISAVVSGTADDTEGTTLLGSVIGSVTGIMNGTGTVIGTVSGTVSGELSSSTNDGTGNREYSIVSGTISGTLEGAEHGAISGTVSGTLSGAMIGPYEFASLQYTTSDSITAASTIPLPRRHHGGNSVIFAVSFGEAYDCRLTAWDDATHSTTSNKVLAEEHYRVDAVAFRSNSAEPHAPVLNDTGLLVHPEAFDIPLKGNEKYFGDFDLIFAIDSGEYGEYVVFTPRLVNMDDSFIAGGYDFVTTLHYQYT